MGGFVSGLVDDVTGAVTGLGNTLGGKPAGGGPNLTDYQSPEIQKQIDFANQLANSNNSNSTVANNNQLADRAQQIQVAQNLGQISAQQAAVALNALAEQNTVANQQQGNIAALQAQAQGQGPSLALDTLKKGTDKNISQLTGAIASQRGVPAGLAARTLANSIGGANQQAAADAATTRIQEQLGARSALEGALSNERNAAYATGANASSNQLNATNAQGYLGSNTRSQDISTKQLADAGTQSEQTIASNNAENQRKALENYETTRLGGAQKAQEAQNQFISGIGSGIASIATSDETKKKDIKPAEEKINTFLDALMKTKQKNPKIFDGSLDLNQKTVTSDKNMKKESKGYNQLAEQDPEEYDIPEEPKWDDFLLKQTSDKDLKTKIKDEDEKDDTSQKIQDAYKNKPAAEGSGVAIGQGIGSLFKSNKSPSLSPGMDIITSDKKEKKDIESPIGKIESFLDAIKAHQYKYKKEAKGMPGVDDKEHISPMAQEFEKTEMGKGMVIDTPKGKVVDYGKGIGALFASLAHINEKIKELEKGKK